jgi:hypothetical protein
MTARDDRGAVGHNQVEGGSRIVCIKDGCGFVDGGSRRQREVSFVGGGDGEKQRPAVIEHAEIGPLIIREARHHGSPDGSAEAVDTAVVRTGQTTVGERGHVVGPEREPRRCRSDRGEDGVARDAPGQSGEIGIGPRAVNSHVAERFGLSIVPPGHAGAVDVDAAVHQFARAIGLSFQ